MNEESGDQTPKECPGKSPSPARAAQAGSGAGGRARIKEMLTGLVSALGMGQSRTEKPKAETDDVSTRLAHQRTDLAMERNYLAAERTLMGWIRTSLSMISFGFTIGKLGQVLHEVNVKGFIGRTRTLSIENIAYFLVILGTVALLGAALQHWQRMRELRAMGLRRQFSITFIVALLLAVVGGFALSALILAL
jgi:putative membrane protein